MIELKNVTMKFRMANDRITSLKEFAIKKVSGKLLYKEFVALNDVSFSIKKGEVIGILGSNGAGKSTLLKIISGILKPTEGTIKIEGNIAPLLELGAGFDIDLTAKENIYLNGAVLGYSKQYLDSKYAEIVEFSELHQFMEMPIRNFSSGMTARLAFAIATLVNPDILIVDEILSVGDARFQKKSSKRMKELINGGATVILVSHSIEQIREMCSRVIWLDSGVVRMIGNTDEVCNSYNSYSKDDSVDEERTADILSYKERLFTPTQIQKIEEDYCIVDCWHHRIIFNKNLNEEIKHWKTFSGNCSLPHSVVSDGNVVLVEDTKFDKVKVFNKVKDTYTEMQSIGGIGSQPNKIIYDRSRALFYGISASTQELFILKNNGNEVIVKDVIKLSYLGTAYTRAISIIENKLYFVSGPGKIIVVELDTFKPVNEFEVPFEIQGMNDITRIGKFFYISVYQNGSGDIVPELVRVKDLANLKSEYESLYHQFGFHGVPYYFSEIDNRYFITEIDMYSSIKSFMINKDDQIIDIRTHHDFGKPDGSSLKRKKMK